MTNPEVESRGNIEVSGDQATVKFERHYARPRHEVWQALTDPTQLARWMDDAVVELRVGGRFEIYFSDGPMLGTIADLETDRLLAYSWHEGRDDESHVRWELDDDGDATVVHLTHTRLRRTSRTGFAAGWHHHLELLAALLAGNQEAWQDARFTELLATYEAAHS